MTDEEKDLMDAAKWYCNHEITSQIGERNDTF